MPSMSPAFANSINFSIVFLGTLLVGEPPLTRLFGTKCPKEIGCVTAAAAPVPYCFARLSDRIDG